MSNPLTDVINLFKGLYDSEFNIAGDVESDIAGWLKSAAGDIASGLEAGFVALFKDLWNVIEGPLEILAGAVLILFAIVVAFKDDLMQAGKMFGTAG